MSNEFYIDNLVTTRISQGLKDNILKDTLKPITQTMTFYVSNEGDDETADGSQLKPFRTLQACYDYIRSNYYFCKADKGVQISFLTDYTDTSPFRVKPMCNAGHSNINYIIVNINNKNVVLKGVQAEYCTLVFDNGTTSFSPDAGTIPVYNDVKSKIYFKDAVSFNIKGNSSQLIISNEYSSVEFNAPVNINFENECTFTSICFAFRYSRIRFTQPITITGSNITVTNGFVYENVYSYVAFNPPCVFNNSIQVTGKRFNLTLVSTLDTGARGNEFIPGSTEGYIGDTCHYV